VKATRVYEGNASRIHLAKICLHKVRLDKCGI